MAYPPDLGLRIKLAFKPEDKVDWACEHPGSRAAYFGLSYLKPNLHVVERLDRRKIERYIRMIEKDQSIWPIHIKPDGEIINGTHSYYALKELYWDCDIPVEILIPLNKDY